VAQLPDVVVWAVVRWETWALAVVEVACALAWDVAAAAVMAVAAVAAVQAVAVVVAA